MIRKINPGIAAAVAIATVGVFIHSSTVQAAPKHDSNTLHKIGNAIQYPVRKMGENVSKTAHRGTGKNSVDKNHTTGKKTLITSNGDKVPLSSGHRVSHRRHHARHHRHHHAM